MDQVLSGGCLCDGTLPHHRRTRRGAETRSVDEAAPPASGPPSRARARIRRGDPNARLQSSVVADSQAAHGLP